MGTAETQNQYTEWVYMSESIPVPLILLAYFRNYLHSFWFLKLFSFSLHNSYICIYPHLSSPMKSMGIYAVHQVKCICNNLQNKGLIFHSEGEKNIKSYTFFISKANLQSFMKCDTYTILLPKGMPDLCFP